MQHKPLTSNGVPSQSPDHVQAAVRTGGQPLDHSTREFFESELGFDLRSVRIHTGSQAAESAQALTAKAYTLGNDVVFGEGRYQPGTADGRHLLAHELAHVTQAGFSSGIHRETIYREPDAGQIMAEIQMLRMQLIAPVNPLAGQQRMRLMQLEAMLNSTAGKAAPPSKPNPSIELPFEVRFSSAWLKAKEAAAQRIHKKDRDSYSGSITRGLMKIEGLTPSPNEVWTAGRLEGLFKTDERALVQRSAEILVSDSYKTRYKSARYGHTYGDESHYRSGSARRDDDSEIWSRGRTYGLFFLEEKAQVLRIAPEGVGVAGALNAMAKSVDPNSLQTAKLMDVIHRFTSNPAVVLLGPEIERLLGPYGYKWRDHSNRWFASDDIEKAYNKYLAGRPFADPNASLADRWDEAQRRKGVGKNDLEQAAYDPRFFQSKSEFDSEYLRRSVEYQTKFDACGKSRLSHFECRDRIDAEYRPVQAARQDAGRRWAYQESKKIDDVRYSGAIGTTFRLGGYLGARLFGADPDQALRFSEGTAAVGGVGDAMLPVGAAMKRNAEVRRYDATGGHVLPRDATLTPPASNVAAPPKNDPVPPPTKTTSGSNAGGNSSVGTMPRNLDLAGKAPVPTALGPVSGGGGSTPPPAPAKTVHPQSTGPLRMDFGLKYVKPRGELTKEGIEFLKREYPEKFGGLNDRQVQTEFQARRTGAMFEKMILDEIVQHVPKPPPGAKGQGQPFLITGKNFANTVAELEKKVPGSVVDKSPLDQSFRQFIAGNADLQKRAKALETNKNEAVRNEWDTWINKNGDGPISAKKPDALEVIPSRNLGVFYDPALPVNSPFGDVHALKTELYRQILLKITNMDVGGMDIGLGVINLTGD